MTLITIPPPQMVANMKVGKMDGFCVGEPWNTRAIADGIGFTAITTQQMWKDHPGEGLAFTEEFADEEPEDGARRCMRACSWRASASTSWRTARSVAEVVARPQYINSAPEIILGRLLGKYDYGDGRKEQDKYYMIFFDRHTNYPLEVARRLVADAVPPLGHGQGGARLQGHRGPGAPRPTSISRRRRRSASRRRART